jgi:alanyl-tRNA synthetase
MDTNQIRRTFLKYFEKNGHRVIPSSPLVPHNDPSLMFTTAGMVQFKNYFTGLETPDFAKAASSQKCVRAGGKHNDLENVGYTARHHTFFEMLGNFSFGDYFKERAIELAWNLLVREFGIDKSKLYITVYHTDDEAFNIWKKLTGFSDEKIIRISTVDNFWVMGDTGPCGPCSEIFYDHGEKYSGGLPGTQDADGDRYIEIWNLVFMQYEDQLGSKRIDLPKPSIDTGMGLERLAAVLQGKNNNFDIDIFQTLIQESKRLSSNHSDSNSHKVIADHIRSICFLIADGVMPSNEGRGYVLRRIMRRAMRHVHNLGSPDTMLHRMVPTMVADMGDAYHELRRAQAVITSVLELEETRFRETLAKGMKILDEEVSKLSGGAMLPGVVAFKLYDTYGFPLDLTCDILRNKQISVDIAGFEHEMEEQKKRARSAWAGSGEQATDAIWFKLAADLESTDFLGYSLNESEAKVSAIVQDGKVVDSVTSGKAIVLLNQTPFYAEAGGQIGDTGTINDSMVIDTKKYAGKLYGHHVNIISKIEVGQVVKATIDVERRQKIKANHSATHLLHKALRKRLGEHVMQKGSLVAPDRLRFDFSHPKALTQDEIVAIEKIVNEMVITNFSTNTKLMSTDDAIEHGAMALFGEKYGDEVRVVSMGSSLELCGGTHVHATGEIGAFKVVSEEAISSGVRRIEAMTGLAALEYLSSKETLLKSLAAQFKCLDNDLPQKITTLMDERKALERSISQMRIDAALKEEPEVRDIKDIKAIIKHVDGIPPQEIRTVLDVMCKRFTDKSVIIATSNYSGKASIIVSISKDLLPQYNANELAKAAAQALRGNGGGRPDQAQAGGDKPELLDSAVDAIITEI